MSPIFSTYGRIHTHTHILYIHTHVVKCVQAFQQGHSLFGY